MNQKIIWVVGIYCICSGFLHAQTNKVVKPLLYPYSKTMSGVAQARKNMFELGNFHVSIPLKICALYEEDLFYSHFDLELNPAVYHSAAVAANNAHILNSLQQFLKDYKKFYQNSDQIARNIHGRVFMGKIPYAKYLPQNIRTLYIGEVHGIPELTQELRLFVSQLPKSYPNRRIYFLTEFLPAYEHIELTANQLITNKKEVDRLLGNTSRLSTSVIYAALDAGIPVMGLEPEQALANKLRRIAAAAPSDQFHDVYEEYVVSFEGMRFRNRLWAKRIRALQAADPEALIVVYAGFGHLGYHQDFNLPRLLGGKSFVMLFTVPEFLRINNPLFQYMREHPAIVKSFRASDQAKLVESWKGNSPYKKIIGTDMAVILHAQEEFDF